MRVLIVKLVSAGIDFISVLGAFYLAAGIILGENEAIFYASDRGILLAILGFFSVVILYVFDIYPNYRRFNSFAGIMQLWDAFVYVALMQGLVIYLCGSIETIGRGIFAAALILQGILITSEKACLSLLINKFGTRERALIIGYNPWKEFYFNFLKDEAQQKLPIEIAGIVSDDCEGEFMKQIPFPVLGKYEDIEKVIKNYRINTLVITSSYAEKDSLQEFLIMAHHNHMRLVSLDSLYEETMKKIPFHQVSKADLLNECLLANKFAQLKKKRVFDIFISVTLILLLFPISLLIAIMIRFDSPGSIFYLQERVGFRGDLFKMIKFRTMRMNAETGGKPVFTERNDPRVTKFGRFLRKTHLDEIPQLLNVLKGDMSFVGPRPERAEFIKKIEKRIPIYALRLFTKPGITGWAQVTHGYTSTISDLEEKFCYDLYYLKHMTLSFDIKIILLTVSHLFYATGQ